ncbi:cardiolipin synthase [Muricauda sp. 334s03]|uniref:Cardiolipin synthase n=2 Tax=Flagellimonas TaxID=444459 RepID=A0ABT5XNI2_9FLAO|nr:MULTISPECIES: cardiolipin synthase [Allomuricauda]MDF0707449.1 cardiolipin synthase [[Muricauda] okinawensis]MDF0715349.1 cardiolipin synthase [[Muricauda] yonaguniensis]
MEVALILYLLLTMATAIRLLVYGARPTKTLAWLLAIFALPVSGILLYLAFGRNRKKNKFFKLKKTKAVSEYLAKVETYYENAHIEAPVSVKDHIKLVKAITKSSSSIPLMGNRLTPLKDGPLTFDTIFDAIETAEKFIHIQYYIFEEGELADRFLSILERKAREGVQVHFIYDGVGSRALSKKYIASLKRAGIKVYGFLPMRLGSLLSSINYRNHRKIVIVDGLIAFTGGINVSDKYIKGDPALGVWHDMHLQLEGPIVNGLQAVFAVDWSFVSSTDDMLTPKYLSTPPDMGNSVAQIIASGPDSDFAAIHHLYFSIINMAKKYVYITNPYIIPGDALMEALRVAALGGVDIRLLVPEASDSAVVKWGVRSYFEDLLEVGAKIFLFQDGFLHSKVIVCDDQVTTIGTANLDIRSFEQNYEVNVLVYEREFSEKLRDDFLEDCKKSIQVDYQEYLKRPKMDRLKEGMAKVFSPVL